MAEADPLRGHPRYYKIRSLNEGTFGFVDLALDAATGAHVAVKFLERGPGVNKAVLREILNHRLCAAHPNIVRFQEVFLTPRHLAIVMEYAAGGDMFEYVLRHRVPGPGPTGLTEGDARHFFQQLVCAVEFAHELGVANRDIKLENTLLDDAGVAAGTARLPDVKICDFGYSKNEFIDSRPKSVSGTPDYIAPEVLLNDQYDGKKADIWSCGVMLYALLAGALPFAKRSDERANNLVRLQQMFPRIISAAYDPPPGVGPQGLHLLGRMLTADPAQRITIQEIVQHPWFQADLPPETATRNAALLAGLTPPGLQSVAEIEAIVTAATRPAAPPPGLGVGEAGVAGGATPPGHPGPPGPAPAPPPCGVAGCGAGVADNGLDQHDHHHHPHPHPPAWPPQQAPPPPAPPPPAPPHNVGAG